MPEQGDEDEDEDGDSNSNDDDNGTKEKSGNKLFGNIYCNYKLKETFKKSECKVVWTFLWRKTM